MAKKCPAEIGEEVPGKIRSRRKASHVVAKAKLTTRTHMSANKTFFV